MTRRGEVAGAVLAVLLLLVAYYWTHATAEIEPLTPVPSQDQLDAVAKLCACSPINSFGPACESLTWDYDWVSGIPMDYRVSLPASCAGGIL